MSAPKRRTIDERWSAQAMYPYRVNQSESSIEQAVLDLYPTQPYGTHGSVCADLLLGTLAADRSLSRDRAIKQVLRECDPMVGQVLVYSQNDKATGRRVPKSMDKQRLAFRRNLFAVFPLAQTAIQRVVAPALSETPAATVEQILSDLKAPGASLPTCVECGKEVANPTAVWFTSKSQCSRCYRLDEATAPTPPTPPKVEKNLILAHRDWSQNVRSLCESKAADGKPLWDWGMRNGIDGAAIIAAAKEREGDTVATEVAAAVRDACTMHFNDEIRASVGVRDPFDFVGFGVPRYLEIIAAARVPLPKGKVRSVCAMMVGPMGSGKSTNAEALADSLGVPYGKVSMTRGTSPTAFNGKQRVTDDGSLLGVLTAIASGEHDSARALAEAAMSAGDVTVSQWVRIYTGGGVFLFDEIDAADSNLLLIVNDALSSAGFSNSATGQTLARSEAFVGVAAGNTDGLGASPIYGGRERLDGATLDRWAPGRVRVGYDNALESSIIESMVV